MKDGFLLQMVLYGRSFWCRLSDMPTIEVMEFRSYMQSFPNAQGGAPNLPQLLLDSMVELPKEHIMIAAGPPRFELNPDKFATLPMFHWYEVASFAGYPAQARRQFVRVTMETRASPERDDPVAVVMRRPYTILAFPESWGG